MPKILGYKRQCQSEFSVSDDFTMFILLHIIFFIFLFFSNEK